jgi:hypothetical protein
MKATVTHIEDTGTSNLIRAHYEKPDEKPDAKEGAVERGVETHSRFSAHIPNVGDEIDVGDPVKVETADEIAAREEDENQALLDDQAASDKAAANKAAADKAFADAQAKQAADSRRSPAPQA